MNIITPLDPPSSYMNHLQNPTKRFHYLKITENKGFSIFP